MRKLNHVLQILKSWVLVTMKRIPCFSHSLQRKENECNGKYCWLLTRKLRQRSQYTHRWEHLTWTEPIKGILTREFGKSHTLVLSCSGIGACPHLWKCLFSENVCILHMCSGIASIFSWSSSRFPCEELKHHQSWFCMLGIQRLKSASKWLKKGIF